MKTLTIQFEFPDDYTHEEVLDTINGAVTDMDKNLANEMSYTVMSRRKL